MSGALDGLEFGDLPEPGAGRGSLYAILQTREERRCGKHVAVRLERIEKCACEDRIALAAGVQDRLIAMQAIGPADFELMRFTDSPAEAAEGLYEAAARELGPTLAPRYKPLKLLGERGW